MMMNTALIEWQQSNPFMPTITVDMLLQSTRHLPRCQMETTMLSPHSLLLFTGGSLNFPGSHLSDGYGITYHSTRDPIRHLTYLRTSK